MTTDEADVRTHSNQNNRLVLARLPGEVVGKSLKSGGRVSLIVCLLESSANDIANQSECQRNKEQHQSDGVYRVVLNIEIRNITLGGRGHVPGHRLNLLPWVGC